MATIYPFRAFRPRPELVAQVASVPYDVVDRDEARALAKGNPISFLHVTKPEIDLPDDTDPYGDAVYAQGARALQQLITDRTLVQDDKPCLYAYELTMDTHRQTGVVLCASVPEYEKNIVRKHEHTRPDKENDRVRHMQALKAQSGKVFLVHRDSPVVARELRRATEGPAAYDFTAPDGIRHRFWVIREDASLAALVDGFAKLGVIYIADGHHRSAAAARYAQALRGAGATDPKAEHERFLAVSFPESEMQILPYNRVVKDLHDLTPAGFLQAVKTRFDVTDGKPSPTRAKQFGMYLGERWYTLGVRPGTFDAADPVARLDVSLLQHHLLEPLLGITDPRRDKRIDFVGGIRGDGELEKRVRAGWAVAFKMHPTSIQDLFAIADAGHVMPPKSTWFEPKLRDGLVLHAL
jgi:uncharacterized protein (DUF1015 family)